MYILDYLGLEENHGMNFRPASTNVRHFYNPEYSDGGFNNYKGYSAMSNETDPINNGVNKNKFTTEDDKVKQLWLSVLEVIVSDYVVDIQNDKQNTLKNIKDYVESEDFEIICELLELDYTKVKYNLYNWFLNEEYKKYLTARGILNIDIKRA